MERSVNDLRVDLLHEVNTVTRDEQQAPRTEMQVRADLEAKHGEVYNTDEFTRLFTALGFAAPLVIAIRRGDNVKGSLMFTHQPRFYYGFEPHKPAEPVRG